MILAAARKSLNAIRKADFKKVISASNFLELIFQLENLFCYFLHSFSWKHHRHFSSDDSPLAFHLFPFKRYLCSAVLCKTYATGICSNLNENAVPLMTLLICYYDFTGRGEVYFLSSLFPGVVIPKLQDWTFFVCKHFL